MSQTFAALRDLASAHAVAWLEISGIPYAFSDGFITEANKSTLFTDSYTPTQTFYAAAAKVIDSESRSIELLNGKGRRGGFSIKLVDFRDGTYPDGFLTRLFGSQRTGINRTRLTADIEKHAGGGGHNWAVASTSGFAAAPLDLYCELETVRATAAHGASQFNTVTRSRWNSPATGHKVNSAGVWPEVTDWPLVWRGRIVRLFMTFASGGELAGGAASARSSAHQVAGILESISWSGEAWTIECSSIDKLLDREACRRLPRARLSNSLRFPGSHFTDDRDAHAEDYSEVAALKVIQWESENFNGPAHSFYYYIAKGVYTVQSFLDAINDEIPTTNDTGGVAFQGSLSFGTDGQSIFVNYQTDAANLRWCQLVFDEWFRQENDPDPLHGGGPNPNIWGRLIDLHIGERGNHLWAVPEGRAVAALTDYQLEVPLIPLANPRLNAQANNQTVIIIPEEGYTLSDFSASVGDRDIVAISSQAGISLHEVVNYTSASGVLQIRRWYDPPKLGVIHEGTEDNPIYIQKVCYLSEAESLLDNSSPLVHGLLRILLSTGVSGYNDANYDTLAEGIGIEWPHETPSAGANSSNSLINITSFEQAFADAAAYNARVRDIFFKPFKVRDWVEKRLAFFGYYLTIEDGRLTARRGAAVLRHQEDWTLNDKKMAAISIAFGRDAGVKTIKYKTGFKDWEDETTRSFTYGSLVDQDLTTLELADSGVIINDSDLQQLAMNILVEFSKEGWRYTVEGDRSCLDIEPGQVGRFSDEGSADTAPMYRGVPNPDGTRGHNSSRMICLSSQMDYEDEWRAKLELYLSKIRRGGYSASAWIESFTNIVNAVLTCSANVFSATADGVDTSRFDVGDRVRVLAVNADTTQTSEQGVYTITAISGNTITLNGTIDTAGANAHFASGEPLVLTHDKYEATNQTASAQEWCYVGDSSGDIDDGGDEAYVW